jgi:NAD(P)-dependent dehydrogenase (short-subunit alcohol dehydrogenase family)
VLVADLDGDAASAVAEQIRRAGGSAAPLRTDVTSPGSRDRMVAHALERYGRIDILVNNAATVTVQPPLEIDQESWRRVFDVNTEGLFFCCQAVLPTMVEQGYGRIVNLASIAAKIGNPAMLAYNASKAAVVAITRNLGVAFARQGVRVNCVLPGIVDTPMWVQLESEAAPLLGYEPGTLMADRVATIPVGRAGTPEDVAGVVAFLVSPDADYMTGQAINVTGGLLTL